MSLPFTGKMVHRPPLPLHPLQGPLFFATRNLPSSSITEPGPIADCHGETGHLFSTGAALSASGTSRQFGSETRGRGRQSRLAHPCPVRPLLLLAARQRGNSDSTYVGEWIVVRLTAARAVK